MCTEGFPLLKPHGRVIGMSLQWTTKIALIDDNVNTLEIYNEYTMPKLENVYIKCFSDPFQALEEIVNEKYDIVITDNAMPQLEGMELIDRILKRYKPHIILVSVMARLIAQKKEVDYFFNKPVRLDQLCETIEDILEKVELKKEEAIKYAIDNLLFDIHCMGKDRIFVEEVVRNLLYDLDTPMRDSFYVCLEEKLNKEESVIRKNIKRVIDKTYEPTLFEKIFGFKKKPKNKEFINKILEKIQEEAENKRW